MHFWGVSAAHLLEATQELGAQESEGVPALEARLKRFGERMLGVLTHDKVALAVYRMVAEEAGRSDVGRLFYESGPAAAMKAIAELMEAAMERGELRPADPKVTAAHFTALVMAEADRRLYQRDPPPLTLKEIGQMVGRGVDMFMREAGQR